MRGEGVGNEEMRISLEVQKRHDETIGDSVEGRELDRR